MNSTPCVEVKTRSGRTPSEGIGSRVPALAILICWASAHRMVDERDHCGDCLTLNKTPEPCPANRGKVHVSLKEADATHRPEVDRGAGSNETLQRPPSSLSPAG